MVALVVQQEPVQRAVVVPLDELSELAAHEQQLLARMPDDIAVERAQVGELLVVLAGHLVQHTALAVHHLVVAERQDKMLGEGVEHREGQLAVAAAAPERVELHVVERVVHEAHVPFECEAQAAALRRGGDARVSGALLRDRDAAAPAREAVDLAQQLHRAEVDVAAVAVAREVVPAAEAEVEHTAHRVHAQPVRVVAVEQQRRGAFQEAADGGALIVEDQRTPVGVARHFGVAALVGGRPVETGQAVLVAREVGRDPVEDHADAGAVQAVHEIHEVLRRAVAAGGGEVAGHLIAPARLVGVLRHRQQLHVGVAHVGAVVRQRVRRLAVVGPAAAVARRAPGAEVHLVDVHRGADRVALAPRAQPVPVAPVVAGRGLAVCGVGVGLVHRVAAAVHHGVFVDLARPDVPDQRGPGPAVEPFHRDALPAAEVALQPDHGGVGRPDGEAPAPVGEEMRAEHAPGVLALAPAEAVQSGKIQSGVVRHGTTLRSRSLFLSYRIPPPTARRERRKGKVFLRGGLPPRGGGAVSRRLTDEGNLNPSALGFPPGGSCQIASHASDLTDEGWTWNPPRLSSTPHPSAAKRSESFRAQTPSPEGEGL